MKNKRVPGGAVAGSVIIAIVITIILSASTFMLVINQIFTEKFITATISNIRIEQIEIPVELNGKTYDSISDAVVGQINENNPDSNISEEEVEEFFDESGINEFIGEKFGVAVDALMNGEATTIITNEEIMNFIEDNEELVEDTFDIEITEEDKQKIEDNLVESGIEEALTTETVTNVITETEDNPIFGIMKSFRAVFSITVIIAGYVVVALLWLGVFFLNKRQLWYAGPYIGVPAIVVGAGVLISAMGVKLVSAAIASEVGEFIKPEMFNALIELLIVIGVVHLLVGIVVTVVSNVVKRTFAAQDREYATTLETQNSTYPLQ